MDGLLFIGGILFIGLGVLSFTNRDFVWSLYNKDKRWREMHPERTAAWDSRTRKQGRGFVFIGIIFLILSFLLA